MAIPCGYRFVPSDDELLSGYLLKKVNGEPLPSNAVTECDIYGDEEPWKIFGESTSQKFYFFTKLKKLGKGGRIERKTGCGTWKIQNTVRVKDSGKNHVGFRKLLVFEVKGPGSNNVNKFGHWIMHEFSLLNNSDYVVCDIKNKHGTEVADEDEPRKKRMKCNNSVEDKQSSLAMSPISTLESDEALASAAGAASASNVFTEATPISALASDEALAFASGAASATNDFTEVAPLASDKARNFATVSNYEDGRYTTDQMFMYDEYSRLLLGAEDGGQIQFPNESPSNYFDARPSASALESVARYSDSEFDLSFLDMISYDELLE